MRVVIQANGLALVLTRATAASDDVSGPDLGVAERRPESLYAYLERARLSICESASASATSLSTCQPIRCLTRGTHKFNKENLN